MPGDKLTLAYCEDEEIQASQAEVLTRAWAAENGCTLTFQRYPSAEALLFDLDGKAPAFDLVLLDIAMGGMDGFTLAGELRRRDSRVRLAFLTSDPGFVFRGYEVRAWRYLLKPLTSESLGKLLGELRQELSRDEKSILLELGGENRRIYLADLEAVEAAGHTLTLHLAEEDVLVRMGLDALLDKLNAQENSFIRCHRSAAVNIRRVERITREAVRMESGAEYPVSRGMYPALNRAFLEENR